MKTKRAMILVSNDPESVRLGANELIQHLTEALIDSWVVDLDAPHLSDEFAKLIYHTPWSRDRMIRWIDDDREAVSRIVVTEDHLALDQEAGRRDRVELTPPDDRHEIARDEEEPERQ